MNLPELHLDKPTLRPPFELNGLPVDLETTFKTGFIVRPEDCPAVVTMIANFLAARDQQE